jgi:hypothetical protein
MALMGSVRIWICMAAIAVLSSPYCAAAQSEYYIAKVHLIDLCSEDQGAVPESTTSKYFTTLSQRVHSEVKVVQTRNQGWDATIAMPREHRYIWFNTKHCEARVPSMSITGQERNYVAVLRHGIAQAMDEHDSVIAGLLPLAGIVGIDLVSPENEEDVFQHGIICGTSFYFDNPPAKRARLRLTLYGGFTVVIEPAFVTANPRKFFAPYTYIRNVSLNDLRSALIRAESRRLRPMQPVYPTQAPMPKPAASAT